AGSARCKGRTSSLTSDRAAGVMAPVPAAGADGPQVKRQCIPKRLIVRNGFLEQTFLDFARQVRQRRSRSPLRIVLCSDSRTSPCSRVVDRVAAAYGIPCSLAVKG